jgi:hypothetical protein
MVFLDVPAPLQPLGTRTKTLRRPWLSLSGAWPIAFMTKVFVVGFAPTAKCNLLGAIGREGLNIDPFPRRCDRS